MTETKETRATKETEGSYYEIDGDRRLTEESQEKRLIKGLKYPMSKGLLLKQKKLFTVIKKDLPNPILSLGFTYTESDVNVKDDQENTPLYYAAKNGNKEVCEFLVNTGARVNERCSNGDTPLHMGFLSNEVMVMKDHFF